MSTYHSRKAADFLRDEERASWHDETLWLVRSKRDAMASQVDGWEALRDAAAAIKDDALSHIDELLDRFEARASENGAVVHRAKDAQEYCRIIGDLLAGHGVRHFVKSKSMLSEECGLRPYLEARGIEVVETDLGERIVQLMGVAPSHIVLPAVHIRRQDVGRLFEREMGTEPGNCDPTYLTHAARANLRRKFLGAEAAMTGANFAVASTGDVVVCTNEGNADMGTAFPPLQIAAFGLEKLIPDRRALGVFTRLLARSATGQPVTAYTSHYRHPREGAELHFIVVDNGRRKILSNPDHWKTLRCLRCGACMNTCPVYRRSGGYSYSHFIPGPLGVNLGMLADFRRGAGNLSACTLCHSCSDVCPGKVDLAEQIYRWRQEAGAAGLASRQKTMISKGMKFMMERPALFRTAMGVAPAGVGLLSALGLRWGRGRRFPKFARRSWSKLCKKGIVK